METLYPLEWFDNLILVKLNAQKNDLVSIMQPHSDEIIEQANIECLKIQAHLKSQVFTNLKLEEIEILIRQYHSSLILLYDYSLLYQDHPAFETDHLQNATNYIISKIDELLSFIEYWFSKYLSLEDRAPHSYLSVVQKDIKEKLPDLKLKLNRVTDNNEVTDIIIHRLRRFSNEKKQPFHPTFRDLLYKKELIKNLFDLNEHCEHEFNYTSLDKLLIYLNYNSKTYINYLTHRIANRVNTAIRLSEKIDQLSLSYKFFKQILPKPEVKLNPNYHDIDDALSNWFEREIDYLEKKLQLSVIPLEPESVIEETTIEEAVKINKIKCTGSADQIALILRAADETRFFEAKSMTEVFKTIIPHLSTENREELSYTAVRRKSYNAEDRDKEKAIESLEKMIKKIKEY